MSNIKLSDLYNWCKVPVNNLPGHPALKMSFRILSDSEEMGELMARELVEDIKAASDDGKPFRAIIPCGPKCWYAPFSRIVNAEKVSLQHMVVFHMDECLNWEGKPLHANDPYNFRTFMEKYFYGDIQPAYAVPQNQRYFPHPSSIDLIKSRIAEAPIDLTLGGWGQDGHVAYNQARRHPLNHTSIEQLRKSELRVQENNIDTIIALAQRSFGAAYQFVPPMSITLGMKECMSAKKIRLYSDTGSWKQTALRVALFSHETAEYPITLLQSHPDVLISATYETARHPFAENPGWQFEGVNT